MGLSTAETIMEITRSHLEQNNGLLFGQCVTAVGWIGGTVPDCEGIVEIPMTDVAGPSFAVGAALVGRRPIFVMRYQGFLWYNCSTLINYAGRSRQVWGVPCPIFIRCLAMEGNGVGHTASSALHSIIQHVPGIPVASPLTPKEYRDVWNKFSKGDDPVFVSEHRRSYTLKDELPNESRPGAKVTLIAISAGRLNAIEAAKALEAKKIPVDLHHVVWIKPWQPGADLMASLKATGCGLVIDSDFELCGTSQALAYDLMHRAGVPVHALGLEDRVCGVAPRCENLTPSPERIVSKVEEILNRK